MYKNICVVGLGYVGLPLAYACSSKFNVVGLDISKERIKELKAGFDSTLELTNEQIQEFKNNDIKLTSNYSDASHCEIYIITVPTPINKSLKPDLNAIKKSTQSISKIINKNNIIIYESTVYPGLTEEICVPILEKGSGLKFNEDFYCGYSPERINPGDRAHSLANTVKITSGSTPEIAVIIDQFYKKIIGVGTYLASNIKVAEAAKVIENIQRDVNIALINEFALICDLLDIDTNEAIEAASTKWNFMKFKPGLVGGHCIGIDPYYLSSKAQSLGYFPKLILSAREINNGMSQVITNKTIKQMESSNKRIKGSKVLILGLSFKANCPDIRNSKVFEIIKNLKEYEVNIDVHDHNVNRNNAEIKKINFLNKIPLGSKKYDAIIVAVDHEKFKNLIMEDYDSMSNGKAIVIDVKGIVSKPNWRL